MAEVKGHWRKLKPRAKGVGPDGSVVYGKTWIDPHKREVVTKKVKRAPTAVFEGNLTRPEKDLELFRRYKKDPSKEKPNGIDASV